MAWFKVDDGFWSHPKTLALPPAAVALWVRAGAWSCQQLTDGFIPDHALAMFGAVMQEHSDLVAVGYWDRDDERGGYVFHDWAEYQESSEVVKQRRADARERMRAVRANRARTKGERSQDVRTNEARTFADGSQEVLSTPTRPDPTSSSTKKTGEGRSRGTRIPDPFIVTSEMREWAAHETPAVNVDRSTARFVNYWRAKTGTGATKLDWLATWQNWLLKDQDEAERGRTRRSKDEQVIDVLELGRQMQQEADRKAIGA